MKTNILIIGSGIVALTIARELISRGIEDILIIEKESAAGLHASGRNSGVLHAGIYYASDSLKAQFCLSGNLKMQRYCEENKLPLNRCGKIIVAKDESELPTLQLLYERAIANGAKVDLVDEKQLTDIEPWAKTTENALYSHATAVVDPKKIVDHLYQTLNASKKVRFLFNTKFITLKNKNTVVTNRGNIDFQSTINAAGAYADTVAHEFGLAQSLLMIPFKGIYRKLRADQNYRVNGNIYPVPNIHNPFLGVHFTKNIHGDVYAGPTAIPAFGRENYGLLSGIDKEAWSILSKSIQLFFTNKKFRDVALTEPKKYFASCFYTAAKSLVKNLEEEWLIASPKAGIRPQLVNWKTKELMMDYVIEETDNSIHLLNAISPAFTSSMAIAEHIVSGFIKGGN
ncbi:MAG: L-2-hydroxyglutarate oxidase [Gammaproteobacteria bacterium]|nr:L-2-hydroxyglutarate oxidase [Gammaproteobacteria bacterium]